MSRFAPGWTMTLVVAVLLPVLVMLGLWQLERAAEVSGYQNRYLERISTTPRMPPASLREADFLRIRLQGEYQPGRHYLVDNRVRGGKPGYWVISRFQADDGRVYLVNRGWLAAPPSRDALPPVSTPTGRLRLLGMIWPDTGLPPLLAPDPWPAAWPKRVQRLDITRMAREGEAVVAAEVRLEPGQPGVLAAAPLDTVFTPERHYGYAVQWFALACVLAVAYLVFGFTRS
jgi:cytochrome oxidase assembly protein ShyY1